MNHARVLNGTFAPLTMEQTVDEVFGLIDGGHRGYLCTVNVAILMMMQADPRLQRFVDGAAITVADGAPLIWASRLRDPPLPERVAGIDLVERICQRASEEGHGVFLLGATSDIVERAGHVLCERFPSLALVGTADGYFPDPEAPTRAHAIRDSGARILIVGMGVPRQERFLEDHWESLGVSFAMGVGGSFDVIAGLRKRAPRILQRAGLEWAFRLLQEPRRLLGRYLVTNTQFIYRLARDLLRP